MSDSSEPAPERFVQIAETKQAYEAQLIALRLAEAGIDARVLDQSYNQEPMPDVRSLALVRVLVPVASAERARTLLAELVSLPEDAELADEDEERGAGGNPRG